MAISALDERSGIRSLPRVVLPAAPRPARRRPPSAVVAAGLLSLTEAVGLLALGLTGLDRLAGAAPRPAVGLLALTLVLLAGWVVLCAGGGAALVDGAGRLLLVAVCCGELVLVVVLVVCSAGTPPVGLPAGPLPLPALALCALAVPTGKLLLAGSPAALRWVADGAARPRRPAPDRTPRERRLQLITVAVIGVALTAVALLGP